MELDVDELLALSERDIAEQHFELALVKLKRCVKEGQGDLLASAHRSIARLYAQLKLLNRAKEHYSLFLNLQPDALLEHFQLGMVLFQMKELEKALKQWKEVEKRSENYPPLLFYRALARLELGDKKVALKELGEIEKKIPEDNLYVLRARQLIQALQSGSDNEAGKSEQKDLLDIPDDVFNGEH